MILKDTLRYELSPEGITLLGYVVRRMHKTEWLLPVSGLISNGETARALKSVAIYTIAASTWFGRAFYQPQFDKQGDELSEPDPATGAVVTAKLDAVAPHYLISYSVRMPDGGMFEGHEEITGTTIGLRGLGMPAPSACSSSNARSTLPNSQASSRVNSHSRSLPERVSTDTELFAPQRQRRQFWCCTRGAERGRQHRAKRGEHDPGTPDRLVRSLDADAESSTERPAATRFER